MQARRAKIQHLVRAKGFITIEHLAAQFSVTPQTIRRDINMLSREGVIRRYHGGAGLPPSTENVASVQVIIYHLQQNDVRTIIKDKCQTRLPKT
ncbi:MAG: DeoR/GlpR transcriptional regulator, partial [Desulfosarcina sp.]|nr:DeoR/GlpR transcriptional regulator [Desulfobacterales bacterium]